MLTHMTLKKPEKFAAYECDDYFKDAWSEEGYFDEASQMSLIVPLNETYEIADPGFLAIGRSDTDSIDFGYRKNFAGIWAFYPIEQEFKFMADSIQELVEGWCSGHLSV